MFLFKSSKLLRWTARHKKALVISAIVVISAAAASAIIPTKKVPPQKYEAHEQPQIIVPLETFHEEVVEPQTLWSDDELQAIAQTLAGECYEDMEHDKRLVCEVILNRVSDERFAETIIGVLETPGAFQGYWHQSRAVSENDLAVAEQTLQDWHANNCQPLSHFRFFCAGGNRENIFY